MTHIGGLRIGLYEPVKTFYVGQDHTGPVPLHLKIAAAITTGAGAIAIANPTDLVKIRMQSQRTGPTKYSSAMRAYTQIAKEEGVRALWTGVVPNMMRNAVMNAAELATYDQVLHATNIEPPLSTITQILVISTLTKQLTIQQ